MAQAENTESPTIEYHPAECIGCYGAYCGNRKLMQFLNPLGQFQLMGFKCMIEIADNAGWTLQEV